MISFREVRVPLPVKPDQTGGYGSAVVVDPVTCKVIVSLPSGGSRSPWCVVDLNTGEVKRGTGMPGDLRAISFWPPGTVDQQPWALATFGLCRLRLDPRLGVETVVRKGIAKYQSTLIDIDDELIGVSQTGGKSLLLVSRTDGSVVKRVRAPGVDVAYPIDDGLVRILGYSGEACDFDVAMRKVVRRHRIPTGRGAICAGDHVVMLTGDLKPVTIAHNDSEPAPDEPLVMAVGQLEDDVQLDLGTWLSVGQIALLDAEDLAVRRSGQISPSAIEVLGVDTSGRVAVSTQQGFVLLDGQTLTQIAAHVREDGIAGAAFVPGHDTVVVLEERWGSGSSLHVVRW